MKLQHSQGVWQYDGIDSVSVAGAEIAHVRSWGKEDVQQGTVKRVVSRVEQMANARLIAHAPELLRACKEVLVQLNGCAGDMSDYFELRRTRCAIKDLQDVIKRTETL